MKTITPGIYPSGTHWTFPEPAAGTIRGTDFEDLVAAVVEFRQANKIAPGDPYNEVMAYICEHNPTCCRERRVNTGPPPSPKPPGVPFGDRVADWVARFIEAGPRSPVPPDVLRRRAAACRACPHNVEYKATCTGCLRRLFRKMKAFTGGYPKGVVDGLRGCGQHVWENTLAIGSDIQSTTAPSGCWVRSAG